MADSNTLVLLHFDDNTNNSADYADIIQNSSYNIEYPNGKFGKAIWINSDTNTSSLSCNDSTTVQAVADALQNEYTVDFWYKVIGTVSSEVSIFIGNGENGCYNLYYQDETIRISAYWQNSGYFQRAYPLNATYNDGNWHHFAFCMDSGTYYMFTDGVLLDTWTNSNFPSLRGSFGILTETRTNQSAYRVMLFDEFRFSNICRWTSDFTPPTQPYGTNYAYLSNNNLYTGMSLTNLTNNWSGLTNTEKEALVSSFSSNIPSIQDLATISPFRVLTNDTSLSNVKVTGQPKIQTITPTSLINTGAVSTVQSINITNTVTDVQVRFAITTDLSTYKVYDATQGAWVTSTDVEQDGMSIAQINALTPQILALLDVSNGIAFKQCFIGILENASAEVSEISAVVDIDGSWSQSVHGTDYNVAYPNKTTMSVTLLANGDYIINYPISSNS